LHIGRAWRREPRLLTAREERATGPGKGTRKGTRKGARAPFWLALASSGCFLVAWLLYDGPARDAVGLIVVTSSLLVAATLPPLGGRDPGPQAFGEGG
jgi:hypothetical protein